MPESEHFDRRVHIIFGGERRKGYHLFENHIIKIVRIGYVAAAVGQTAHYITVDKSLVYQPVIECQKRVDRAVVKTYLKIPYNKIKIVGYGKNVFQSFFDLVYVLVYFAAVSL